MFYYDQRIDDFRFIPEQSQPISLHEGFNKLCGLGG